MRTIAVFFLLVKIAAFLIHSDVMAHQKTLSDFMAPTDELCENFDLKYPRINKFAAKFLIKIFIDKKKSHDIFMI